MPIIAGKVLFFEGEKECRSDACLFTCLPPPLPHPFRPLFPLSLVSPTPHFLLACPDMFFFFLSLRVLAALRLRRISLAGLFGVKSDTIA